ncbi:MAG: hypothetical protein M9947_00190 [Thermomicrobiales bacterium]|nr:hypothetical protein [Thermomicrobiales bacterium]
MTPPLAIVVADDLTGAADAGAPFASAGFATALPLRSTPAGAEVISLSNNTRDASGDRIESLFKQAISLVPETASNTLWYAKVDSVFRGYPGPEIAFLLRKTGRRAVIVAPALPDQGRITVDGDVYAGDVLLTETPLGTGRSSSSVIELLGLPGDTGRTIGLETVRSGPERLRAALDMVVRPIVVVDAETNADLATLADAVIDTPTYLLAGSAGFSKQIANVLGARSAQPTGSHAGIGAQCVLTVAGSRHSVSARQVATLEASGIETVRLDFERGHLDPAVTERTVDRLSTAFDESRSVTVTTCDTPSSPLPGREIAKALAAIATDLRIRQRFDALILTGGDVAGAVCDRLEAEAIWLGGEVLPAIPWGRLHGGVRPNLPVVTKAGSFGDDQSMLTTLRFLQGSNSA